MVTAAQISMCYDVEINIPLILITSLIVKFSLVNIILLRGNNYILPFKSFN